MRTRMSAAGSPPNIRLPGLDVISRTSVLQDSRSFAPNGHWVLVQGSASTSDGIRVTQGTGEVSDAGLLRDGIAMEVITLQMACCRCQRGVRS